MALADDRQFTAENFGPEADGACGGRPGRGARLEHVGGGEGALVPGPLPAEGRLGRERRRRGDGFGGVARRENVRVARPETLVHPDSQADLDAGPLQKGDGRSPTVAVEHQFRAEDVAGAGFDADGPAGGADDGLRVGVSADGHAVRLQ